MALNFTGIDESVYFVANSVANIALFVFIALPMIFLCVLCVVALLIDKDINWSLRMILINIFAANISHWLGVTVLFMGFPVLAQREPDEAYSCHVAFSLFVTSTLGRFISITLYATMVYVFLKYGVKKLKWKVIIACIVISWIYVLSVASLSYFPGFEVFNNRGFCETGPNTLLLHVASGLAISTGSVCLCVILTFSILAYCYTKKATLK